MCSQKVHSADEKKKLVSQSRLMTVCYRLINCLVSLLHLKLSFFLLDGAKHCYKQVNCSFLINRWLKTSQKIIIF